MTEKEAYGDFDYPRRISRWYNPGDKVRVGPAYRGDNIYMADGHEGNYTVVGILSNTSYELAKGDTVDECDLVVSNSRMIPR